MLWRKDISLSVNCSCADTISLRPPKELVCLESKRLHKKANSLFLDCKDKLPRIYLFPNEGLPGVLGNKRTLAKYRR